MKSATFIFSLSLLGGVSELVLHQGTAAQQPPRPQLRRSVVVELFTSEGCSSCPPADRFLAKLEKEQPIRNIEVIALEQHVDYWDNAAWTDPFSSNIATMRQFAYAATLGNENAYTPQMVVDGQSQFVGSRERQARGVIEQAGNGKKTEVTVTSDGRDNDGLLTIRIKVGSLPNTAGVDAPEVWMAITESGLHSEVRGGENAGQDLYHAAVVRKIRKIGTAKDSGDISFSGQERVKLERGWKRENIHVVVFVQENKSKKILGAVITTLPA